MNCLKQKLLTLILISASAYGVNAQNSLWKGKLIYSVGSDIKSYEFVSKTEKVLFQKGSQPSVAKSGEIFFVNEGFPKRSQLIRKSNPSVPQFKDVLDMSSDNEKYKASLAAYSVINNTGNSAVLDRIADPEVSPDGKYLSVTVFGYPRQVFDTNCVAVFDRTTGELVKKFINKYGGTWTSDGRLVMAGSYKSVSVNGNEYHSKIPGIFITDEGLDNVSRIDPELDDPAPYHPAVSPDGKKVAFIMNNHVWVMNLDGSNLKQLTDVDNDNVETFPTWSPDSKFIACWCYKSFELSYYTAIAIVPANAPSPIALTNKANVWPRDKKNDRISSGALQFTWK